MFQVPKYINNINIKLFNILFKKLTGFNTIALSIISYVEFHRVSTSRIGFKIGIFLILHISTNFSHRLGDARILITSSRNYI